MDYPWLTHRERQVFEMFYREGIRIEDIAAALGDLNRSTIGRDLKKIREIAGVTTPAGPP